MKYAKESGQRETLNDGFSVYPDLDSYIARHEATHFDLRIENRRDGWAVTGRIRRDWKERMEADMQAMGF